MTIVADDYEGPIFGPLSQPAPEALHALLHPGEPLPSHAGAVSIFGALSQWRNAVVREADIPRLKTGIPRLDRAMRGIQPGELLGIVARTGSGKTHLVSNIVDDMLIQRPASAALVANLEMPCAQLIGRHLRMHFRQTEDQLERQVHTDTLDLEAFTRRHQNLYFLDSGAQTLQQIERAAIDLQRQISPMSLDCIVVDHCGLVRVGRSASAYERATEVAIVLKQLARQLKTIVVAVIQSNRAGNQDVDPVPLESARDSGAYEENCDFLITMGKIVSVPAQPATVKVRLAKNRRGPTVPVTLVFDPIGLRMRELEEDRG